MGSIPWRAEKGRLLGGLFQAGKFGLVGLSNTVVDAVVFVLLANAAFALPIAAAKAISYLAGVVNSHFWNRRWTFRSSRAASQTFPPFVVANLAGLGLNVLLMQLALDWLHLYEAAAFLFATGACVIWNFLINKLVIFKSSSEIGELSDLPARRA